MNETLILENFFETFPDNSTVVTSDSQGSHKNPYHQK